MLTPNNCKAAPIQLFNHAWVFWLRLDTSCLTAYIADTRCGFVVILSSATWCYYLQESHPHENLTPAAHDGMPKAMAVLAITSKLLVAAVFCSG
jgi:hypothetical protein